MNLIGLPGRDQQTELWLQTLLSGRDFGQQVNRVLRYRHWDSGGVPDVSFEAARVEAAHGDLVIAKSMGTLVLVQAYLAGLRPAAAVLIGVPVLHIDAGTRSALRELSGECNCLFIQQTDDFTGPFALLASTLEGTAATLEEVPGNDHVYADTNELQRIIDNWAEGGARLVTD